MNLNELEIIKRDKNNKIKVENSNIYRYLIQGYKECMPNLSDSLIDNKYFENNHFMNHDFEINPKYFVAFNDATVRGDGIVTISALYVFPEYRRKGFAKDLINILKDLSNNGIIFQVAIYENKFNQLKSFYEKLDFKTTGIPTIPDSLNIRYFDMFWCNIPLELKYSPIGTMIKRLV